MFLGLVSLFFLSGMLSTVFIFLNTSLSASVFLQMLYENKFF